jgi:hypothetical protein
MSRLRGPISRGAKVVAGVGLTVLLLATSCGGGGGGGGGGGYNIGAPETAKFTVTTDPHR